MTVYEFGDETKPAIMLLPGACCYWKTNFGEVIPLLQEKFRVCVVSYDGFDDTETSAGLPDPGAARFPPIQEKLTVLMPVNL